MSRSKPAFFFGSGNIANGGPAGPSMRKESRIRKGWTTFDVWQDRVRRAAEAARLPQIETRAAEPSGS